MASAAEAVFRAATEADLPALVELGRQFYREEGYPYDEAMARAALQRLLGEPQRGRIWIAPRGGRLVGYLILTFGYSIEFHGVDALIDEVYVEPEFRGSGLGTRAIALAEAAKFDR